jgi:hypothetical protein
MNGASARLSATDQTAIATWAALKTMVSEFAPTGHVTTTQADRDHMKAKKLPPEEGWAIWIGHFIRKDWPVHLVGTPFAWWPEPERAHLLGMATTDYNGQVFTQVIKQLFVHVIRCRVSDLVEKWRFADRATNHLRKIWPAGNYSIVWPPPLMLDSDADYIASAFHMTARRAVQRKLNRGLN